jgi:hypothetical protein
MCKGALAIVGGKVSERGFCGAGHGSTSGVRREMGGNILTDELPIGLETPSVIHAGDNQLTVAAENLP